MEAFIGQIVAFSGNFAPRNWMFCHGQTLSISSNTALFSILGTTYGGNGQTTFALPDLRGRTPIGAGSGTGLSPRELGARGGVETVALTANQLPAHTHSVLAKPSAETSTTETTPPRALLGTSDTASAANVGGIVSTSGASAPHENMPPYAAINYIICVAGIYPSRGD